MPRSLAFIDLLGFSKMVEKDFNEARNVLDDFYNISYRIIKEESEVQGNLFSDSLLAYADNYATLINSIANIYRECLRKNQNYEQSGSFFLLPRGAISPGLVNIEERQEAPNLRKDFIVSPALVHSARMEKAIKGGRLLIAINSGDHNHTIEIEYNNAVKSILYDNTSIELWPSYKYKDALWFLDLGKTPEAQKVEVIELLTIAIQLVRESSDNSTALEQHINTLRIGLLSYSKFLQLNEDPVINGLFEHFREDKYWQIWLTIFELVATSIDAWRYPAAENIINFYKSVSLSSGWQRVIEEINKPSNGYLKASLQNFINEMHIATN